MTDTGEMKRNAGYDYPRVFQRYRPHRRSDDVSNHPPTADGINLRHNRRIEGCERGPAAIFVDHPDGPFATIHIASSRMESNWESFHPRDRNGCHLSVDVSALDLSPGINRRRYPACSNSLSADSWSSKSNRTAPATHYCKYDCKSAVINWVCTMY